MQKWISYTDLPPLIDTEEYSSEELDGMNVVRFKVVDWINAEIKKAWIIVCRNGDSARFYMLKKFSRVIKLGHSWRTGEFWKSHSEKSPEELYALYVEIRNKREDQKKVKQPTC